jgi:hypothetical protein
MSQSRDDRAEGGTDNNAKNVTNDTIATKENAPRASYAVLAASQSGQRASGKKKLKSNSQISTAMSNFSPSPELIKKAVAPDTTIEHENNRLDRVACHERGYVRLICRSAAITVVDVAEAFLATYNYWPSVVVPINDAKNSRTIFEVKTEKGKKELILENPPKIGKVQLTVDDCSEDPLVEYELRGCNIRFSTEEVMGQIQLRIGENARILSCLPLAAANKDGRLITQGAYRLKISGLKEHAVELYLSNTKLCMYRRDACFTCLELGHSWRRCPSVKLMKRSGIATNDAKQPKRPATIRNTRTGPVERTTALSTTEQNEENHDGKVDVEKDAEINKDATDNHENAQKEEESTGEQAGGVGSDEEMASEEEKTEQNEENHNGKVDVEKDAEIDKDATNNHENTQKEEESTGEQAGGVESDVEMALEEEETEQNKENRDEKVDVNTDTSNIIAATNNHENKPKEGGKSEKQADIIESDEKVIPEEVDAKVGEVSFLMEITKEGGQGASRVQGAHSSGHQQPQRPLSRGASNSEPQNQAPVGKNVEVSNLYNELGVARAVVAASSFSNLTRTPGEGESAPRKHGEKAPTVVGATRAEMLSTAASVDLLSFQPAHRGPCGAHLVGADTSGGSNQQSAAPTRCLSPHAPTKTPAERKEGDGKLERKEAQVEMVTELPGPPTTVQGLAGSKMGTASTSLGTDKVVQQVTVDCANQNTAKVVKTQAAGMLQTNKNSRSNESTDASKADSVANASNTSVEVLTSMLGWEMYKSLVKTPENKSTERTKTKKGKSVPTIIMTKGYTFKWTKNVSTETIKALFKIDSEDHLSYEQGSIGATFRAFKGQYTQNGGMYLLVDRPAPTTKSQ